MGNIRQQVVSWPNSPELKCNFEKGQIVMAPRCAVGSGHQMTTENQQWSWAQSPATKELLLLQKMLTKLMLALIERCQNRQCITACCVWVCVAADWSARSSSKHLWANESWIWTMEKKAEKSLVWWIMIWWSFKSCGFPDVCASFTWRRDCTKMHYRKGKPPEAVRRSGQCSEGKPCVPTLLQLKYIL